MITVIGSLNMDLIAHVDRLPEPGETVAGRSFARSPGAKGANQAVAAARAGTSVAMVGKVGADAYGSELLQALQQDGINTDHVAIDERLPTGVAIITVDRNAENSIVVVPGANDAVTIEDVDSAAGLLERSALVLLQLEIPTAVVAQAARRAHDAGARVILNPVPVARLDVSLLRSVDILVVNEVELASITGVGAPVEPELTARMLLDTGPRAVVVTLGSRGSVVVARDGEWRIPAFAVDAVDTTGAGDAYIGNLARALEAGAALDYAAEFASAAAALSVRTSGAQPSLPSFAQTEMLLKGQRP